MQRVDSLQDKWWNAVLFLTALLVVTTDQLSKIWIRSYSENVLIFEEGFFRIIRVHNTGAAFGLFQNQSFILTIVAFTGIIVFLLFIFPVSRRFHLLETRLSKLALILILGGTTGNLIDRLNYGYVTDFIGIGIWPMFNIADSAIVIGVTLLAYSLRSLTKVKKVTRSEG